MSITLHPTLWCAFDGGCGNWADVDGNGDDTPTIRKNAKRAGWTRVDGKDYCPDHRKTAPRGTNA